MKPTKPEKFMLELDVEQAKILASLINKERNRLSDIRNEASNYLTVEALTEMSQLMRQDEQLLDIIYAPLLGHISGRGR